MNVYLFVKRAELNSMGVERWHLESIKQFIKRAEKVSNDRNGATYANEYVSIYIPLAVVDQLEESN